MASLKDKLMEIQGKKIMVSRDSVGLLTIISAHSKNDMYNVITEVGDDYFKVEYIDWPANPSPSIYPISRIALINGDI